MTHDELLEKIRLKFFVNEEGATQSGFQESQLRNAVYAVVELHKPRKEKLAEPFIVDFCHKCKQIYPCETIQAIEKELA
jgi:hypothetical protein